MTLDTGLVVTGLKVRYGGWMAVDGLSFEAPAGRITGLIGPNGAGKTTTFNACSGLLRPTGGDIRFFGRSIAGTSPAVRARLGLGRTFQRMQLCDELTVRENVALGREARTCGANPWRQLFATRKEAEDVRDTVEASLASCGIDDLGDRFVGGLSTGQRRLVELARAIAADFRIILLDEPSSGLDNTETERFANILINLVEEHGVGLLLVEHDISLVRRICSYVYVLDFGKLVVEGPANEVLSSPEVIAVYLGSEAVDA